MQRNISAERARKGMSQAELAKLLNVTPKTVRNYENGGDIPSSKLKAMALIFRVSADYLLGIDETTVFGLDLQHQ